MNIWAGKVSACFSLSILLACLFMYSSQTHFLLSSGKYTILDVINLAQESRAEDERQGKTLTCSQETRSFQPAYSPRPPTLLQRWKFDLILGVGTFSSATILSNSSWIKLSSRLPHTETPSRHPSSACQYRLFSIFYGFYVNINTMLQIILSNFRLASMIYSPLAAFSQSLVYWHHYSKLMLLPNFFNELLSFSAASSTIF